MTQIRVTILVLAAAVTTLVLWCATQRDKQTLSAGPDGAQLYQDKGCVACHSLDGTPRIGPSFDDIGATVVLADGSRTVVDATYLRESIMHPLARARPGYPLVMPSYDRQLDAREVDALVAYLDSTR